MAIRMIIDRKASLFFSWALLMLASMLVRAQPTNNLQLLLPQQEGWNVVSEGSTLQFRLGCNCIPADSARYGIQQGQMTGMSLDSTGLFRWTPSFDFVDRIQSTRLVPVIFSVSCRSGQAVTQLAEFRVLHQNRPPVVGQLPAFYVRYQTQNVFKLDDKQIVVDPDGDPVVFFPIAEQLPEGMRLSAQGEIIWTPSRQQFAHLQAYPQFLEFWVEDQPAKSRSKGRLKIAVTQLDMPPAISVVPQKTFYRIREDESLSLKFYLSDPNGEEDVSSFVVVSTDLRIPASALIRHTDSQYEFIWKPGYDFVKDPLDSLRVTLTFTVLDKTQNRDEKSIVLTVLNSVDETAHDQYLYTLYRQALVQALQLITQLEEKEVMLRRAYKKAKNGKRSRSVINASLGAVNGVSPLVIKDGTTQRYVSGIGGTAVATLNTLEATEVIGKSMKDLLDRYNYVLNKKTEIQNKGDIFAREYALKSARRSPDFMRKLDEYRNSMNLSGLLALELDAAWQFRKETTDKTLKRIFGNFTPLEVVP